MHINPFIDSRIFLVALALEFQRFLRITSCPTEVLLKTCSRHVQVLCTGCAHEQNYPHGHKKVRSQDILHRWVTPTSGHQALQAEDGSKNKCQEQNWSELSPPPSWLLARSSHSLGTFWGFEKKRYSFHLRWWEKIHNLLLQSSVITQDLFPRVVFKKPGRATIIPRLFKFSKLKNTQNSLDGIFQIKVFNLQKTHGESYGIFRIRDFQTMSEGLCRSWGLSGSRWGARRENSAPSTNHATVFVSVAYIHWRSS